jgi:hypothetical protein
VLDVILFFFINSSHLIFHLSSLNINTTISNHQHTHTIDTVAYTNHGSISHLHEFISPFLGLHRQPRAARPGPSHVLQPEHHHRARRARRASSLHPLGLGWLGRSRNATPWPTWTPSSSQRSAYRREGRKHGRRKRERHQREGGRERGREGC